MKISRTTAITLITLGLSVGAGNASNGSPGEAPAVAPSESERNQTSPLTPVKGEVVTADRFPRADPETVGIPSKALALLSQRLKALVDNEEIVGGELLVIKNRRTVLRQALGWRDREAKQPLEVNSVYCVRSMTKPLVGTAIQMLIDEGRLSLDTPVQDILPFFAGPQTGKITVQHLLTHTGGFPFTTISKPLSDYAHLAEVAAEAAATGLGFEPGTQFEYSDAGSDTLGAIVAKLTDAPVEQFIQHRILDPLDMRDSITLLSEDDVVLDRIPSAYSGGTGDWSKHWEPANRPIFPLFLASQSLYSTTTDYARFLELWMDQGRLNNQQLLSPQAVSRGLTPEHRMKNYPPSFEGLDVYYGQQWMVYAKTTDDGGSPATVFGHGGSDGTHAWAWPEQDLMVLFFTQSRGTLAGVGLEQILQALLVEQELDHPSLTQRVPSEAELNQVAGIYWDEDVAHAYYVVASEGNRLTLERPGRMHLVFKADSTPGRYVHEANSRAWLEFVRAKNGEITAMRTSFGKRVELDPRHESPVGLPSVEEIVAMVKKAHRVDKLPEVGVVRMTGLLKFEDRGMEGPVTTIFDTTRERTEIQIGTAREIRVKKEDQVSTYTTHTGADKLDGARREQALLDQVSVRYGDWSEHYREVEVLKRVQLGNDTVLLVRVVPNEGPGSTMFVHEESGRIVHIDSLVQIPGLGLVGIQTTYEDFRDVGGMQLPFRAKSKFATPLIGRVVSTLEQAETGLEVSEETFAPPTAPKN